MRAKYDTETGLTTQVKSKALLEMVIFATSNLALYNTDPALLDRFIVLHQVSSAKDGRKPIIETPLSFKSPRSE